ncbi:MAG: hypothetical protein EP343_02280 [Deltaproteobacteria bacterium]|nr:MAG: hypothetical protein EP343_02280 [Deltaproteobacteria bacterium]
MSRQGSTWFSRPWFQCLVWCAIGFGLVEAAPPSSQPASRPSTRTTLPKASYKTTLSVPLVGRIPLRLDPITARTHNDIMILAHVMETLVTVAHQKQPVQLQPLLLAKMPTLSKDSKTFTFTLRRGAMFHDHPCFSGGKGREVRSEDVLFSLKRLAHQAHRPPPQSWWLFKGKIEGLDAFRQQQFLRRFTGKPFQHFAPVKGLKRLGPYRFQIKLTRPFPQFLHHLTHPSTSIVPREMVTCPLSVRQAGPHVPIGTGIYRVRSWNEGDSVELTQHTRHWSRQGKAKLPRTPNIVAHRVPDFQTSWKHVRQGKLAYTPFLTTRQLGLLDRSGAKPVLKDTWKKQGYKLHRQVYFDFIYTGFNFRDPIVGGTSQRARYLRKALSYAIDYDDFNKRFYSNTAVVYQGAIPPGLTGYAGKRHKPNLKKAREYLKKAGYPGGKGLPTLEIATSSSEQAKEFEDAYKRQFGQIGVKVRYKLMPFRQLAYQLRQGTTQMFSLAWSSDYPDAENNFMLFAGKNKAPGPNSWNYNNPRYNKLFEQAVVESNPARQARMYRKLNQMLIDDAVFLGSMARTLYQVTAPGVAHFHPSIVPTAHWQYITQTKKP